MVKRRKVKRVTPEERKAWEKAIEDDWKVGRNRKDVQQEAVYKWERKCLHLSNQCDWTMLECERFIAYVWHSYFGMRATLPKIDPGRGRMSAAANRWVMILPVWSRNRMTILHELGHALLDAAGRHEALHGPRWARMFVELLAEFGRLGRAELISSAREAGVKVARRDTPGMPRRRSCEKTIAECRTKHYHSFRSQDLDDWMRKGTPRLVHVKGKTYREQR